MKKKTPVDTKSYTLNRKPRWVERTFHIRGCKGSRLVLHRFSTADRFWIPGSTSPMRPAPLDYRAPAVGQFDVTSVS